MHALDDKKAAFYHLANRYLTGEASGAERQQMVQGLKAPELKQMFEEMRSGWELEPLGPDYQYDLDAAALRLAAITGAEEARKESTEPSISNLRRFDWRPFLLAACLVIASGILITGLRKAPAGVLAENAAWVQRSTGPTERLTVNLRDGTKVILNANGSLIYPIAFNTYARVVRLTGEAYFEVAHNEASPFVVETDSLRITVLGTRFNVRAYANGSKAQVSIVEGRVQVSGTSPSKEALPVVVTPGQQYTFSPETGKGQVREVATESVVRWMQSALAWEREPLPSALRELEKRYGVPFEIADPILGKETITARFDLESLEEIVEVLRLTGAMEFRIVQDKGRTKSIIVSSGRLASRSHQRGTP